MITREEYELLKYLKKEGFNWIARDEDDEVSSYTNKPFKETWYWLDGDLSKYLNHKLFTFIKCSDTEPTAIADLINEYAAHEELKKQHDNVVIPQYVTDFINKAKPIMSLYSAMYNLFHFGSISMETPSKDGAVRDWVEKNEETFARAWLDGYEIELEKKYIIKFASGEVLISFDTGLSGGNLGVKLTQSEIEEIDPRLMQFAEEVE